MMKSIISISFSLSFMVLVVISPHAYAAKTIEECEPTSKDSVDYSRCLDGVVEKVDREMQIWINNQIFTLEELSLNTGRKSALNMFKRSQSNFIKFRENNCRWQYLALSPNEFAASAYKKCYVRASRDRINELALLSND